MRNYILRLSCYFLIYLRRIRNIRAKRRLGINLTKTHDLVDKLQRTHNEVCHIIASGSSVLDTIPIINSKNTVLV